MKRITALLLMALLLATSHAFAARIDTVMVHSQTMDKALKVLTIVPEHTSSSTEADGITERRYPVLYLLHGYGDNCFTWPGVKPDLPAMADRDGIIVVCPSAENSWYWDSPIHPESQFETFVSSELIAYIDSHYPTIACRQARAITGLSMGGHGALWLSIRHQNLFGACGSTSGGVDLRPFPKSWNLREMLGDQCTNETLWYESTVMSQLDRLSDGSLSIIIDCGTDDVFYKVNLSLHQALLERHIGHDFLLRPGAHNAAYWRNSIDYQWLFFKNYFSRNLSSSDEA